MVKLQGLEDLLQSQLKQHVKKIDEEAYYPREFLLQLGKSGYFQSEGLDYSEVLLREARVVEETAKVCMTTAFNIWCHLASLTYIRATDNMYLKNNLLPLLESGELLGATGLSNPMKYYAGLEKLHLQARRVDGGYTISGTLPAVSNLGRDHWFGIIASIDNNQRIMAYVQGNVERLVFKEKLGYLGLNGSATYACQFDDVFIPDDWVIAEQADSFVEKIRPAFVLYQIPLGFGVTGASIQSIDKVCSRQAGCNKYLAVQSDELSEELQQLRSQLEHYITQTDLREQWKGLLNVRLQTVHLTSKATHACMLHQGSAGYLKCSPPSRRLRESYFFVNLTPTVRHLGKMLS
ncbi:acyl-CoA dehydrogenase family protein [Bacillus massiliigorillae]|uniref:acyl-CoA dehydrogenase family protein n=1 Tax=Bacillus massiliigorillae TaxID=1243664 RepID=UPI0003A772F3|nr:acyl-CoA dehydrogenase family protein [Bacillus massiliigorillae]